MISEAVLIKDQPAFRVKKWGNVFLFNLLTLFTLAMFQATLRAQEKYTNRGHGYITESMARERATFTVMPSYQGEVPGEKMTVVIKAKIEIAVEGNVLRAAVQPGHYPLLREAIFKAIKQWTFKSFVPSYAFPDSTWISRLTFVYIVENGESHVEMYTPPPDARTFDRLDSMYPPTDMKEWREWVDIYNQQQTFSRALLPGSSARHLSTP
jgi:hypothetical protein